MPRLTSGNLTTADADHLAQVGDNGGEHVGLDPAAGLLVDGMPGWQTGFAL